MKTSKDTAQKEKEIFASNLTRILREREKTQSDLVTHLSVTSSTVSDWANANKYPRIDKMQAIADYLHVSMSDLREEKSEQDQEKEKFIRLFENLDDNKKKILMAQMQALINLQDSEK